MSKAIEATLRTLAEIGSVKALESLERLTDQTWLSDGVEAGAAQGSELKLPGSEPYQVAHISWPGACALLCLTEKDAATVAQAYVFSKVEPGEDFMDRRAEVMQRLGESAVSELANILVHAVANAWANFCGKGFLLTAPTLLRGGAAEVSEDVTRRIRERVPKACSALTLKMSSPAIEAQCELRFLFSAEAVEQLSGAPK